MTSLQTNANIVLKLANQKKQRGFKMNTYILENISDGGLHYEQAITLELALKQAKFYTKSKLQLFEAV